MRVGHDGAGTWYVKRGGVVLATRPSFRSIEQAVRALLAARDGAN